ncbi:DNA-directed DNA polymerase delta subunit POL31 Ecym_4733 [Eremothecium cymbalariae DBVPG|uniref:DNA-directed DNA polymerase n=1 Tax=Eremothecium cymbalariae (strain CBS 270.75 / DBVPG 7215 / KCTC 17166 / NRRL Y-17582) TaxID=931890 RepID=G8JSM9_ERECY|nr:hypothetical protein Ecym_4733 [Eremothecium cymbalariae DBVPG\
MDNLLERFDKQRSNANARDRPRLTINHEKSKIFDVPYLDRVYDTQYFPLYQYRLEEFRKRVTLNCQEKWDDGFQIQGKTVVQKKKVLDIQATEPSWCVGTIYCEMKYKPNILEEVINDTYGVTGVVKSYTDIQGSDEVMLEDESGRILLIGDLIKNTIFVTGIVVGVLGMEAEAGTFQVLDICYPKSIPQAPLSNVNGKKVAFISGLNMTPHDPKLSLRIKVLQDMLSGDIGHFDKMADVARLILCGNSLSYNIDHKDLLGALDEFGGFLVNVLKSLPITMLPGASDPTEISLPQQPLNKALFKPSLKPYFAEINDDLFEPVTNPYWFDIEGTQILATSGQNIDDICKYIIPYYEGSDKNDAIEHRLNLMEATLKWQNIAPTAPDTLWSFPFKDRDPFILKEWPHVYIVGNQPEFGHRKVTLENSITVHIISLPAFSETGQFLVLDLGTLESETITIEVENI